MSQIRLFFLQPMINQFSKKRRTVFSDNKKRTFFLLVQSWFCRWIVSTLFGTCQYMQKLILLYFPLVSPKSQLFSFLRSSRLVQGLGREKEAQISVADSELPIREAWSQKQFFFGPWGLSLVSIGLKKRGSLGPRAPPLDIVEAPLLLLRVGH